MKPTNIDIVQDSTIDTLYNRASSVIDQARETAYRQVNEALVKRNWELGKLITEEELNGQDRAIYGASIIKDLSKRLTATYGKGFTKSYLYSYVVFYKSHLTIFQSPIGKSNRLLSWTHYYILTQELNANARSWYEKEALQQNWSVRTLQRNLSSQYYFRLLASQRKDLVENEMLKLTASLQDTDPTGFIKNPVIGEFLGFTADYAIDVITQRNIVDCDYGEVNHRPFFCTFGVGFDAAVSHRFAQQNRRGKMMYIKSAIDE
ncbi:MAG: hypothetical protein K2N79_01750, partial [Muribaculaceae bacterium]|nr:hypothetical protein [Muribaculaceae bacterium]